MCGGLNGPPIFNTSDFELKMKWHNFFKVNWTTMSNTGWEIEFVIWKCIQQFIQYTVWTPLASHICSIIGFVLKLMIVYNARSLKGVVQVQYDILLHLHTLLFHSYIIILIADPKIETDLHSNWEFNFTQVHNPVLSLDHLMIFEPDNV